MREVTVAAPALGAAALALLIIRLELVNLAAMLGNGRRGVWERRGAAPILDRRSCAALVRLVSLHTLMILLHSIVSLRAASDIRMEQLSFPPANQDSGSTGL